jgi:hypothetical protein
MLRDILQNIMSANMPDKLREVLIAKTLRANQEIGEEDCVSIFDVGVRYVVLLQCKKEMVCVGP